MKPWVVVKQFRSVSILTADRTRLIASMRHDPADMQGTIARATLMANSRELLGALEAICTELFNGDNASAYQIAKHAGRAAMAQAYHQARANERQGDGA